MSLPSHSLHLLTGPLPLPNTEREKKRKKCVCICAVCNQPTKLTVIFMCVREMISRVCVCLCVCVLSFLVINTHQSDSLYTHCSFP